MTLSAERRTVIWRCHKCSRLRSLLTKSCLRSKNSFLELGLELDDK